MEERGERRQGRVGEWKGGRSRERREEVGEEEEGEEGEGGGVEKWGRGGRR